MQVKDCIREAKEIMDWGLPMLVVRIGEIAEKHSRNEKLTKQERLIIGLRYSEFLAEDTTDYGYYQASIKQDAVLKKLGIDFNELMHLCRTVCGLH